MNIDLERITHWRERAEQHRILAEACSSPGARGAYHALALCADSVADRMERGALTVRAPATSIDAAAVTRAFGRMH
jgi:hypothetical protein